MNTWLWGWIFSLIMLLIVYFFSRKGGFQVLPSLLLGVIWFPSPLFYAIGGVNSVVYFFDFIVPIALTLGIKNWRYSPVAMKKVSLLLFFSLGFMPIFTAIGYASSYVTFLLAFINLYRLTGALSLMVYFSSLKERRIVNENYIFLGFGLAMITVVVAMVCQGFGHANSNILESILSQTTNYEIQQENIDQQFIVLGMFRGSLGILGMVGISIMLSNTSKKFSLTILRFIVGICGLLIIILSGSKTSLFCALLLILLNVTTHKIFSKNSLIIIASIFVLYSSYQYIYDNEFTQQYVPPVLYNLITNNEGGLVTISSRLERYEESLDLVTSRPEIFIGFVSPTTYRNISISNEVNVAYFHNEYLSVFMLGGIFSFTSYIAALFFLVHSFCKPKVGNKFSSFSTTVLTGSLIQGLTVAHLQPGILFPITTAILCSIYGLGSSSVNDFHS